MKSLHSGAATILFVEKPWHRDHILVLNPLNKHFRFFVVAVFPGTLGININYSQYRNLVDFRENLNDESQLKVHFIPRLGFLWLWETGPVIHIGNHQLPRV